MVKVNKEMKDIVRKFPYLAAERNHLLKNGQ